LMEPWEINDLLEEHQFRPSDIPMNEDALTAIWGARPYGVGRIYFVRNTDAIRQVGVDLQQVRSMRIGLSPRMSIAVVRQ
jgi:hypothetical protein